jgi:hypothetical protein
MIRRRLVRNCEKWTVFEKFPKRIDTRIYSKEKAF